MKRPWNLTNLPVYSLVTNDGLQWNMNICTYVMPVSRSPKMYMIAIENDTKSCTNMHLNDTAVLQLLHTNHAHLVKILGKKSGFNYDKVNYLNKKQLLTTFLDVPVLEGACAYIELKKESYLSSGDHQLFLCGIGAFKSIQKDILTEDILRYNKIIFS